MQKQLSKKSHKPTESSIDDFMKHIRKYNLQSERHISPKPLLYMYTNPSRNFTLQTLQKSRSKSKTLSNRQHSNSKKSSSKAMRQKVEKMLSITRKQNIHKKSLSSISNKNEKSIKKLNKSTAQIELTKSKQKLKTKLNQFKLKPMTTSNKKTKKSKIKFDDHPLKIRQSSQIGSSAPEGEIPSEIDHSHVSKDNPAQLIEMYSKKLFKVQLFLQSNKSKLGSMLCRKFQQILNEIVQCLVQNLKKSLNELQADIQKRLTRQFQRQFDKSMMEKEEEIKTMEKMCEKITKKFSDILHKQHYSTSLLYNLRLRGIDIDNEFGRAIWGVQNLGGLGYGKSQLLSQNQEDQNKSTHRAMKRQFQQRGRIQKTLNDQSSSQDFEFRQHPNVRSKREVQPKQIHKDNYLIFGMKEKQQTEMKQIQRENQLTMREQQQYEFRMRNVETIHKHKLSV